MENIFMKNRNNLIDRIEEGSVIILDSGKAMHKTLDQFHPYTPNRNFYFITGLNEPNVRLMIVKGKKTTLTMIFIEETTEYMRQWLGENITKEKVSEITGIENSKIYYLDKFELLFKNLMTYGRGLGVTPPKNLYMDLYRVNSTEEPIAHNQFKFVLDTYKELNMKNVNEHLSYLRMFKSTTEIEKLEKAIKFTEKGLYRILDNLKVRTNEFQLDADFRHQIKLEGSLGISFDTIAASGKNATVLHYEENNSELIDGNLILFDLGALHSNYGADISRTYPINGKYTDRQKTIYEIVLKVNKESIKFVKPGISWKELNKFAKDLLAKECMNIGLIKAEEEITKYYYHSIGHFLGLDVHDVGHYELTLEEGMVITIEPGLYISEENIGIRIEDDILVTKNGSRNLSKNIIKEVKDIEEYLSKN